jgi:hypothetical protein
MHPESITSFTNHLRDGWKATSKKVHGLKTIQHKVTGELSSLGKYGEIYEFGDGTFRALVTNAKVANRLCKYLGSKGGYKIGDEAVLKFTAADVKFIASSIKIYYSSADQLAQANRFTLGKAQFPDGLVIE